MSLQLHLPIHTPRNRSLTALVFVCILFSCRALADRGGVLAKDRANESDNDEFFEAPSSDLEDSSEVYKQAALAAEEELVRVKEEREMLAARLADMEERVKKAPLPGLAKGSSSSAGGLSVSTSERKGVPSMPTKTSPRARVGGTSAMSGSSTKSSNSAGGPFSRR